MELKHRLEAFESLGKRLHSIEKSKKEDLVQKAWAANPWFTPRQADLALQGICHYLERDSLRTWLAGSPPPEPIPQKVGVVMAGNIPFVGFHDLLSVLISGHVLVAKLSTQDTVLMTFLINELISIEPDFQSKIILTERMNAVDALIATGSDNTARHFEYYFRNIPHIIRKNRSSCAIIRGDVTNDQLRQLAIDIFSYYGLGCRNVSKIFVPDDYDLTLLLDSWKDFSDLIDHHKYANNYDYNKSLFLVGQTHFYDTGYALLTENASLVSPISVIYYERFSGDVALEQKLMQVSAKIQCVVSLDGAYPGSIPFGKAQSPELWDYADAVNTLDFLKSLASRR